MLLKPIGRVKNNVNNLHYSPWESLVSELLIEEEFAGGLDGIEEFSHLIVIFWLHQLDEERDVTKVHPENREDLPLVGVFATRSPRRPNPLGITAVKLLERKGRTLKVEGLDAVDGTPIIDLKPYLPRGDLIEGAKVADWLKKLWEES